MNFSSTSMHYRRHKPRVERPGGPPFPAAQTHRGDHEGDFILYLNETPREPREIHLSASRPGKCATRRQASPAAFRLSPQNLADLNKPRLKVILMMNEIVIRPVRNIWYYGGKSIAE